MSLGTENLMSCLHVDDYKGLVGIDFQARDQVFGSNQKEEPMKKSKYLLIPISHTLLGYLQIFKKNMNEFGIKILIIASIILIVLRLSFEWENRRYVWIEGTSILGISILVTLVQSLTEFRIGKTLVGLKITEQSLIKDCILLDGQEVVVKNEGDSINLKKETFDTCIELRKRLFATFFHHEKNSLPSMILLKQTFIIHGTGKLLVISVSKDSNLLGFNNATETDANDTYLGQKIKMVSSKLGKPNEYDLRGHYQHYIQEWIRYLLDGITLLVAAVPEGINLALTLTLINSTQGMLKQNYLVKAMKSIETIGRCEVFIFRLEELSSINSICPDKRALKAYSLMCAGEIDFKKQCCSTIIKNADTNLEFKHRIHVISRASLKSLTDCSFYLDQTGMISYKNIRPLDANLEQIFHENNKLICLGLLALKEKQAKSQKTTDDQEGQKKLVEQKPKETIQVTIDCLRKMHCDVKILTRKCIDETLDIIKTQDIQRWQILDSRKFYTIWAVNMALQKNPNLQQDLFYQDFYYEINIISLQKLIHEVVIICDATPTVSRLLMRIYRNQQIQIFFIYLRGKVTGVVGKQAEDYSYMDSADLLISPYQRINKSAQINILNAHVIVMNDNNDAECLRNAIAFGSFGLAFEKQHFSAGLKDQSDHLFSSELVKYIIIHSLYQVTVCFTLLFGGDYLFQNLINGRKITYDGKILNDIDSEENGKGLDFYQWIISFAFGIGSLFIDTLTRIIPNKLISKMKLDILFQKLEITSAERIRIDKINNRRSILFGNQDEEFKKLQAKIFPIVQNLQQDAQSDEHSQEDSESQTVNNSHIKEPNENIDSKRDLSGVKPNQNNSEFDENNDSEFKTDNDQRDDNENQIFPLGGRSNFPLNTIHHSIIEEKESQQSSDEDEK
ncbi:cation transport atpase [Stylonychia lemnae]|uniref:Cation transport atpase n=1 Tax=Stylonychia lemnae TaxID=5949 RepID=A0A077ZW92_STYLE|nr:cation transport atpase [Stylonychia lemnae]|eukprot:CDW73856.1 cation transport atpase [Stylonychia lemnae]